MRLNWGCYPEFYAVSPPHATPRLHLKLESDIHWLPCSWWWTAVGPRCCTTYHHQSLSLLHRPQAGSAAADFHFDRRFLSRGRGCCHSRQRRYFGGLTFSLTGRCWKGSEGSRRQQGKKSHRCCWNLLNLSLLCWVLDSREHRDHFSCPVLDAPFASHETFYSAWCMSRGFERGWSLMWRKSLPLQLESDKCTKWTGSPPSRASWTLCQTSLPACKSGKQSAKPARSCRSQWSRMRAPGCRGLGRPLSGRARRKGRLRHKQQPHFWNRLLHFRLTMRLSNPSLSCKGALPTQF